MSVVQNTLTDGSFETEQAAWERFDQIVQAAKSFTIYREVAGEYVHPRLETEVKGARIDRILVPRQPALDQGWSHGAIGVEGKKSGHKLGKLVCQALDYHRCAWHLPTSHINVFLKWVFIYPVDENLIGDIESVMAQNRIGYSNIRQNKVRFCTGATCTLAIESSGAVEIKTMPQGGKRGSR